MKTLKMVFFWNNRVKCFNNDYPAAIWQAVRAKFVVEYSSRYSAFCQLLNEAICHTSVVLSIRFSSERDFKDAIICRIFKFLGVWTEWRSGCFFLRQSFTKYMRLILWNGEKYERLKVQKYEPFTQFWYFLTFPHLQIS